MRAPSGLPTALAGALALALLAGPARAGRVDVVVDAGHTLAVERGPGGGGIMLGTALLWPLEEHFRVGMTVFADALGQRTDRLIGPGGTDLGPVSGLQRSALGAGVRLEAHVPGRHAIQPHLAVTWGLCRVDDDLRGVTLGRDDAAGLGLALGLLRPFNARHAVGLAVRGQQLTRGEAGRYVGVALEWRWSVGAAN